MGASTALMATTSWSPMLGAAAILVLGVRALMMRRIISAHVDGTSPARQRAIAERARVACLAGGLLFVVAGACWAVALTAGNLLR